MQALLKELAGLSNWYDLGLQLGLSTFSLWEIKVQSAQDVMYWKTKLFNHWLRNDADASWKKLADCLELVGEGVKAHYIRKKYCPETIEPAKGIHLYVVV